MAGRTGRKYHGKRKENLKADMLATVASLNRRGMTQTQIAQEVGLSQGQISVYLRQMRQAYLDTAVEETKVYIEEKLEQLREIRLEAWNEWERSKKAGVRSLERNTAKSYVTEREVIGRLGDHRYLQIVFECLREEMKLRGIGVNRDDDGKERYAPIDWVEFVKPVPDDVENRLKSLEKEVQDMEPIEIEVHPLQARCDEGTSSAPYRNGDTQEHSSKNGDA